LPETLPPPPPRRDELAELPRPRPKPPVRRVETAPPAPVPVAQPERTPPPPAVEETPPPPRRVASLPAPVPAPIPPPAPSGPSPEALKAYGGSLFQAINTTAARNYPARALQRNRQGTVPVRLTIDAEGALLAVEVLDDSQAHSSLVKAAVKAVQRAAPFPAFGTDLGNGQRQFDVRIVYKIR
jgi:protein TonB